jgi:hypothetical protein
MSCVKRQKKMSRIEPFFGTKLYVFLHTTLKLPFYCHVLLGFDYLVLPLPYFFHSDLGYVRLKNIRYKNNVPRKKNLQYPEISRNRPVFLIQWLMWSGTPRFAQWSTNSKTPDESRSTSIRGAKRWSLVPCYYLPGGVSLKQGGGSRAAALTSRTKLWSRRRQRGK